MRCSTGFAWLHGHILARHRWRRGQLLLGLQPITASAAALSMHSRMIPATMLRQRRLLEVIAACSAQRASCVCGLLRQSAGAQ